MVIIILGSKSDLDWGNKITKYLMEFKIEYKIHIASAHKTPEYLLTIIKNYEKKDLQIVYICVAGRSNALGGFVDAQTKFPVINCPPYSEKYKGLDILSSLRMPSGISCVTVIEPEQAALAVAKILAQSNKNLEKRIELFQKKLKSKIINEDKKYG